MPKVPASSGRIAQRIPKVDNNGPQKEGSGGNDAILPSYSDQERDSQEFDPPCFASHPRDFRIFPKKPLSHPRHDALSLSAGGSSDTQEYI
jgi:hypothetical protein